MPDAHTRAGGSRRRAIRNLATFMAGSPLMSLVDANGDPVQTPPAGGATQTGRQGGPGTPRDRPDVIRPPAYRDEIMKVINLHEFEDAAKKALSVAAYDYVAAGAGDELTLRANREAFSPLLDPAQGDGRRHQGRHVVRAVRARPTTIRSCSVPEAARTSSSPTAKS